MTAEEALAAAEAEGLTLLTSDKAATGYVHVKREMREKAVSRIKPYEARMRDSKGRHLHIGCFATAEEAAHLLILKDAMSLESKCQRLLGN